MIGFDSAGLFGSLFQQQQQAPANAARAGRHDSRDHPHHMHGHSRRSRAHGASERPALYDRSGSSTETAAVADQGATAAALEYRRSERTTLQIRTQEGDIVNLRFRVKDALSAQIATVGNGETTLTELSVNARSSTRLKISVEGDLNADELAAIQSIVEQASVLANEFFTGGTAEAAALASSFDLNAEQLAQVQLRLAVRERLTYSQMGSLPVAQPEPIDDSAPAVTDAAGQAGVTDATTSPAEAAPSASDATSTDVPVLADVKPTDDATGATQPLFVDVLSAFETIATFLTNLLEALSEVPEPSEPSPGANAFALRYDVSFKLRVFQSILVSVSEASGEESDDVVPPVIEEALEGLAVQQEPALEALA